MYNPTGFGSRDIDVVIPTREMKEKVIDLYLFNNGYEIRKRAFGEMEWIKELEPDNPNSITYLDVCTTEDRNLVHGGDLEIPWKIAYDNRNLKDIDGVKIYVPKPEALFLLKVKAAWDRDYDIQNSGGNAFLRDKVIKDRFDIISLLKSCPLNHNILKGFLDELGFDRQFKDAVARSLSDEMAVKAHSLSDHELKTLEDEGNSILKNM